MKIYVQTDCQKHSLARQRGNNNVCPCPRSRNARVEGGCSSSRSAGTAVEPEAMPWRACSEWSSSAPASPLASALAMRSSPASEEGPTGGGQRRCCGGPGAASPPPCSAGKPGRSHVGRPRCPPPSCGCAAMAPDGGLNRGAAAAAAAAAATAAACAPPAPGSCCWVACGLHLRPGRPRTPGPGRSGAPGLGAARPSNRGLLVGASWGSEFRRRDGDELWEAFR